MFKNSATMMGAQLVTWLSGFAVFIFVPRFLGSDAYGRVYLAISFQMILWSLIDFGAIYLVPKEIARDKGGASATVSEAASLRLLLWIVSLVIALLTGLVAGYTSHELLLIMILVVSNLWINMTSLMRDCFMGFEDMKYPSIGAVVERGFLALTVIPALFLGARELVVVVLIAASGITSFLISAKYSRHLFKFRLSMHLKTITRQFKTGLPYFLWAIFGMIYFRIDAVLLSLMAPVSVVGWYGAAYRFFDIVMFLPAILTLALYPIISRLSQSEGNAMIRTAQYGLKTLLLASIPIAVGFIFFAKPVIGLLIGLHQFGPSVIDLQLFSVGTILVYLDFALVNTVQAIDKQKQWAYAAFFAMLLNIGLNAFLIRHYQSSSGNGGIGAAIATDITELFVFFCAVYLVPKQLFDVRLAKTALKAVISGLAMAAVVWGGMQLGIIWIALVALGILAYGAALFLLRTFNERELELMMKAVSMKRLKSVMSEKGETSA